MLLGILFIPDTQFSQMIFHLQIVNDIIGDICGINHWINTEPHTEE